MKTLFILMGCITALQVNAQVWVESNAVWHYDYWNLGGGGFYTVTHVGDTIIGGKNCKHFEISSDRFWIYTGNPFANDTIIYQGSYDHGAQFTYHSNDSVYRWEDGSFRLLFDFNAQVGDQWVISTLPSYFTGTCTDTSIVEVVGTGIQTINGSNYRYIELQTPLEAPWQLNGTFNERFGGDFIFPLIGDYPCAELVAEMDILSFKCFEDDSMSLYNPSGEDCEYMLTHLDVTKIDEMVVDLYPNPATEDLIINNDNFLYMRLFSQDGRILGEFPLVKGVNKFSINTLENGIYFLTLVQSDGREVSTRLVKK